jgi:hypothetical protein
MKTTWRDPPRRFDPDGTGRFAIADAGCIELGSDEQVTFVGPTGSEYDVVRRDWGYYATPSLNSRLPANGLRPLLARNGAGRFFVCLIERGRERQFADYAEAAGMQALGWLDHGPTLERVAAALVED